MKHSSNTTPLPAAQPDHHDGGFTLVELLVVVIILGILATVSVFAVQGVRDQTTQNTCAQDLSQHETAVSLESSRNGEAATLAALDAAPDGTDFLVAAGWMTRSTGNYEWNAATDVFVPVTDGACDL